MEDQGQSGEDQPKKKDEKGKDKKEDPVVLTFESLLKSGLPVKAFKGKSGEHNDYWQTEPWFIEACLPHLSLNITETVVDAGSGVGLIPLQLKFYGSNHFTTGFEIDETRHQLALVNRNAFDSNVHVQNKKLNPCLLIHSDFTRPEHETSLVNAGVLFVALDPKDETTRHLKKILEAKTHGKRVLTNLELVTFSIKGDTTGIKSRLNYQVVKIEQNRQETKYSTYHAIVPTVAPVLTKPKRRTIRKKNLSGQPQADTSDSPDSVQSDTSISPENVESEAGKFPFGSKADYTPHDDLDPDAPNSKTSERKEEDPVIPNTTASDKFIPFFLITRIGHSIPAPLTRTLEKWQVKKADKEKKSDTGFTPYLQGKKWISCSFKLRAIDKTGIATVEVIPRLDSKLKLTMIVRNVDLYSIKADCDSAVKQRNDIASVPNEFEPYDTADYPENAPVDMNFVFHRFIPLNYAMTLKLKKEDMRYIGPNGINEGEVRFDVVEHGDAKEYINTLNPHFKVPVLFRGTSARSLNTSIPDEKLADLRFTLKSPRASMQLGVAVTDADLYQRIEQGTLADVLAHVNKPSGSRGPPKAVTTLSLHDHPQAYKVRGPEALMGKDLSLIPTQPESIITSLSRCVDIVGRGSLQRWHCHSDGTLVWTEVSEGMKLFLFNLNATDDDYVYISKNENRLEIKKLIPDSMKKRVFCVEVKPGDVLVYPSSIPHAILSVKDTLSYSGRLITTIGLSDITKYTSEQKKHLCKGPGYPPEDIQFTVYHAAGKVFDDLIKARSSKTIDFKKDGFTVINDFAEMMSQNKTRLNISTNDWTRIWNHINAFLAPLKLIVDDTFGQSVCAAFFHERQRQAIDRIFYLVFGGGKFIPIVRNVVDGLEYRTLYPPTETDLDWRDPQIDDIIPTLQYDTEAWNNFTLSSPPKIVLSVANGTLKVVASQILPAKNTIAEFTGEVITASQARLKYNTEAPYGRMFRLRTIQKKKKKPEDIFLDANKMGGYSLFLTLSETPNCILKRASVGGRLIFVLVTRQRIEEGELITVRHPPSNSIKRSIEPLETANEYILRMSRQVGSHVPVQKVSSSKVGRVPSASGIPVRIQKKPVAAATQSEEVAGPSGTQTRTPNEEKAKDKAPESEESSIPTIPTPSVETEDEPPEPEVPEPAPPTRTKGRAKPPAPPAKPTERQDNLSESSDPESSESEDEESRKYFTYEGHRLKKRFVGPQRKNRLSRRKFKKLTREEQDAIDSLDVAMIYPNREVYNSFNDKLLAMYKVPGPWICGICTHLRKLKIGAKKGFEVHASKFTFDRHFGRYHQGKVKCEVCGLIQGNARDMANHLQKMLAQPNAEHKKAQDNEKKGKKAGTWKKKKKSVGYVMVSDASSDDEDFHKKTAQESSSSTPETSTAEDTDDEEEKAKKQKPKPKPKPKATKKKPVPKAKKVTRDDESDDDYSEEEKKRTRKKKK